MDKPSVEGFKLFDVVSHAGIELPVFVSEQGCTPLIVLHELPGMTPEFIGFCNEMVGHNYKVYMPLMFGEPENRMSPCQMAMFCLSQEFRQLFKLRKPKDQGRAFPRWLLHLTNLVVEQNSGQAVGVIGMCLTGGFAIAAIANKKVGAAVACQPAYPFFFGIRTLGLTAKQQSDCADRCQGAPKALVKGYRYSKDKLSRNSHMKAIEDLLGSGFERYPDLPGKGHSTVTDSDPARNRIVTEDILKFLAQRLS